MSRTATIGNLPSARDLSARIASLEFDLKARMAELEIADGEIERLRARLAALAQSAASGGDTLTTVGG